MRVILIYVRDPQFYASDQPFQGAEVLAALDGRYGALTRITPGERSLTMFISIPIRDGDEVVGAVLVSRSTSIQSTSLADDVTPRSGENLPPSDKEISGGNRSTVYPASSNRSAASMFK